MIFAVIAISGIILMDLIIVIAVVVRATSGEPSGLGLSFS